MFKKSIIIAYTIFGIVSTSLFANQTTMCFKQNHQDLITIENTKLDGGECASNKSANDMKNEGWTVNNIQINPSKNGNGTDFIYIFKKEAQGSAGIALNEEELMARLQEKMKDEEKQKQEENKKEQLAKNSKSGETFYMKVCASCHGTKGELNVIGTSKPIKDLTHTEFQTSIKDYVVGNRTHMLMSQYANLMDSKDIRNVYTYLKFINQKNQETKEE